MISSRFTTSAAARSISLAGQFNTRRRQVLHGKLPPSPVRLRLVIITWFRKRKVRAARPTFLRLTRVEVLREPSTDVTCVALGLVKPDLAVFDVLGFSSLVAEKGLAEVTALYSRLITEAVTKEAMRTYTIIQLSENQKGSVFGALLVSHAHFSDTILLWAPSIPRNKSSQCLLTRALQYNY